MKNHHTPNSRQVAVFLSIALLGSVVFLTGCTQNETRVSDAWLRAKYTERLLATLKESQFAGDAETGVTGGADVVRELSAISTAAFPDGEYMLMSGNHARKIAGWEFVGQSWWPGVVMTIYRRLPNIVEQKQK
jgi:hypothetical protein